MAIAAVSGQAANNPAHASGADTLTLAYPSNVAVDNLVIAAGSCWSNPAATSVAWTKSAGTATIGAITDIESNRAGGVGGIRNSIAYAFVTGAGSMTWQMDPNPASNDMSFSIHEYSADGEIQFSVDGGQSTADSSSSVSDGITTATDGELVVGLMVHTTGSAVTMTETYGTLIGEEEDNSTYQGHNAQFKVEGAAGAKTVTWTTGSAVDWLAQTVSFKEIAAQLLLSALFPQRVLLASRASGSAYQALLAERVPLEVSTEPPPTLIMWRYRPV